MALKVSVSGLPDRDVGPSDKVLIQTSGGTGTTSIYDLVLASGISGVGGGGSGGVGAFPDVVSVYGAKGDGASDDYAPLQAAASSGRAVFIVNYGQHYLISNFLNLASGTKLIGIGKPTIRTTAATRALRLNALSGVEITGIVFDGDGMNAGSGILMQNAADCVIENCDFIDFGTIAVTQTSPRNKFRGNRWVNAGSTALQLTGAAVSETDILNNNFQTASGFGIWVNQGSNRNLIQGNRCQGNGLELIGVTYNCWGNRIIGNHAEGTGDNGISITGYNNTVVGNTCRYNAFHGICIYGRFNTVVGNVCVGNGQASLTNGNHYAGISLTPEFGGVAEQNVVSGNFLDDDQTTPTQYHGIKLVGAGGYAVWAAGTPYTTGTYVTVSSTRLYLSTNSGTSGGTTPVHTSGTVSDGAVSWLFIASFTSREAYGNVISGNRLGRSVGNDIDDGTINKSNYIQTETFLAMFGSGGINTITGPIKRRGSAWASSGAVIYGDYRYNNNNVLYRCANVGGTMANQPTHTSGTVTAGDGIAWRFVGAGQVINHLDISQNDLTLHSTLMIDAVDGSAAFKDLGGSGSPEGVVTAPKGSTYRRFDGGAGTCFYVKESGTGATGWVAK